MAEVSQSIFLQALGWGIVISLGQMGVMWAAYMLANRLFTLPAQVKYMWSVTALAIGFLFFGYSYYSYYHNGFSGYSHLSQNLPVSFVNWQWSLSAASLTYLLLLIVPVGRLIMQWHSAHILKTKGLYKAHASYIEFVQTTAARLGIKKKVQLYLSDKATSPLMVGFYKPFILLPLSSITHLSPDQVEAILLHELAHIRRYDYLVNIFIQVVRTVLYFNPFVHYFMQSAEAERENCCDEVVVQYGYNKARYASALLILEKSFLRQSTFAMAAGKKPLLSRIEKLAGLQKKPVFSFYQFTSVLVTLILVLILHSLFIYKEKRPQNEYALNYTANSIGLTKIENQNKASTPVQGTTVKKIKEKKISAKFLPSKSEPDTDVALEKLPANPPLPLIPVSNMEVNVALTADEKDQVKATVAATQKVLRSAQWSEVEKSIADGMTKAEKEIAKQHYLQEINNIDWKNIENVLKADYAKIDWEKVTAYLSGALIKVQLDSLKNKYQNLLATLEKIEQNETETITALPYPDCTVEELQQLKKELQNRIFILHEIESRSKSIKL